MRSINKGSKYAKPNMIIYLFNLIRSFKEM